MTEPPALDPAAPARRADARFLLRHPAHWIALGFGSGLSPWAPGTIGTLWAWVAFLVLDRWLDDAGWAWVLLVGVGIGVWACTQTARHLAIEDPSSIVWDEVLAFWAVLWMVSPTDFAGQLAAFALFRFFDAVKPGPVGWADRRFKRRPGEAIGWRQGWGILFDDAIAALCTLLVIAVWRTI